MAGDQRARGGPGVFGDDVSWLNGRHGGRALQNQNERRGEHVWRRQAGAAREPREQAMQPCFVRGRQLASFSRLGRLNRRDDQRTAVEALRGQHLPVDVQHLEQLALGILVRRGALFDVPANLLAPALERLQDERVFGPEEVVDRRFGQSGLVGHPLGGDGVQSLPVEELAGGVHQPLSVRGIARHQTSELDRVYCPVNNFTNQ